MEFLSELFNLITVIITAIFGPGPASPAKPAPYDLLIECKVTEENPAGAKQTLQVKYYFDFSRRNVREYQDRGGKTELVSNYRYAHLDDDRVVLQDTDDFWEKIDRRSGLLSYRNHKTGVTQRGVCTDSGRGVAA
jgi:hypothetical protein